MANYRRKKARRHPRCMLCTFRLGNKPERHSHHSVIARDPLSGRVKAGLHKLRVDARRVPLSELETSLDTE